MPVKLLRLWINIGRDWGLLDDHEFIQSGIVVYNNQNYLVY